MHAREVKKSGGKDERALAALLLQIALINSFNRIAVPTRRIAGNW